MKRTNFSSRGGVVSIHSLRHSAFVHEGNVLRAHVEDEFLSVNSLPKVTFHSRCVGCIDIQVDRNGRVPVKAKVSDWR